EQGFLILEDLGDERVVSGDPPAPMVERYETAVDVLLALHTQPLPDTLPVAPELDYRIPPYDMNAFLIEAELLVDWFLPRLNAAIPIPNAARSRPRGASRRPPPSTPPPPGRWAASLPPNPSGCPSATNSPGSAFSISRTP